MGRGAEWRTVEAIVEGRDAFIEGGVAFLSIPALGLSMVRVPCRMIPEALAFEGRLLVEARPGPQPGSPWGWGSGRSGPWTGISEGGAIGRSER